jgi:hypothetical protein
MTAHRGKFIAYYRVSTDRQGQSGLGLEAQQKAVLDYLNGGSWTLAGEFTEVESGKHADRPQLAAFAANVRPIIRKIQNSGISSLRGVARALTAGGSRLPVAVSGARCRLLTFWSGSRAALS